MTWDDEATLWRRSGHLKENRLPPSSDDSDNICGTPLGDHTCDWDCLTMHTFVPCPPFFYLLKPTAHVCTPKMAEGAECSLCLFPRCVPGPVRNLLSLPSPRLFIWYLGAVAGSACGISGVWVLDPKLQLHSHRVDPLCVCVLISSCKDTSHLDQGHPWTTPF
jgi:hypothetical protein